MRDLPLSWRGTILAVVIGEFLFAHGLPWRHVFHWDAAILWTYATIPAFVLVALALRRSVRVGAWLFHTVEIASAKFVVTSTILMGILVARYGFRPVEAEAAPPPPSAAATSATPLAGPPPAVTFEVRASGVTPPLAAVSASDRIAVRSGDGALHSARLERADGTAITNLAVLPSGDPTVLALGDLAGEVVTLRCAVHGTREPAAHLIVVNRDR